MTWADTPAGVKELGSARKSTWWKRSPLLSPVTAAVEASPAVATGHAGGRPRRQRDLDVVPCAFVDWDRTSSQFYTLLGSLLERQIRLLIK